MRLFAILLTLAALGACSSAPPPTQRYLLTEPALDAQQTSAGQQRLYAVGDVQLSQFLSGAGLVYKLDENRIHEARQHRWAEPLTVQLRRQLRQGMQQQLIHTRWLPFSGSRELATDYQLDLQIEAFHINHHGEIKVAGQWQLRDEDRTLMTDGSFSQQRALTEDGYAAAVSALSQAWHHTMVEIAGDLLEQQIDN